ncbi:DUF547 domain-containing protein [Owenweeksia hongkongensis]|uniref:DUF547 domain-containing protein n=1 Tax=Owenweeksia hongkongensis TaxID=253245 RepID=UPI003A9045F7
MKRIALIVMSVFMAGSLAAQDYVEVSKNLLKAMRDKDMTEAKKYVDQIANGNPADFQKQIDTQEEKLAFWINTYNGLIQYELTKNPAQFDDRGDFFGDENVTVLGEKVSFDNLEHGVMRRNTSKYSKGYFSNPFSGDWYKQYQFEKIDWRIHFALNCGAASCPPVRIYDDKTVYQQLNASSKQYLDSQVKYDKEEEEVYAPKLMDWFSGDFGGSDGALKILKKNGYIPSTDVDLEFNDYDWTLKLGTFYKD